MPWRIPDRSGRFVQDMVLQPEELRAKLRGLGLSREVVDAAWPDWWSDEASSSVSATAELSYTVARRLGLSPSSLLEEQPEFIWRHDAKFKNLGTGVSSADVAALTSFGRVIGQSAIRATSEPSGVGDINAPRLRHALISSIGMVNLESLVTICWGLGIPVCQLKVFPLDAKRMHAMSISFDGRHAVLLGQESRFPSAVAFTIAHELGHIFLGHLATQAAVVDMESPLQREDSDEVNPQNDDEERAATAFALELLTGEPDLAVFGIDDAPPTPSSLARAATDAAGERGIDPGLVVLSYAYRSSHWAPSYAALRQMGQGDVDVSSVLNAVADAQFQWEGIGPGARHFLRNILGLAGDDA